MRFISKEQEMVFKDDKVETWFNMDGKEISEENEQFFAKVVEKRGSASYYVRTHENFLLDPIGMYSKRRIPVVMSEVSKNTFDYYMLYLNTKNNLYLTRAERGYINE